MLLGKGSFVLFVVLVAAVSGITLLPRQSNKQVMENCPFVEEVRTVRGNSLAPLIQNGQAIKILFGYYDCHDVGRGDLVVYRYGGTQDPIIKSVKGVEGDAFSLQEGEGGFVWHMLINNAVVKNSQDQPYIVGPGAYNILSLYIRDYGGIIPENSYLILGDLVSGSLDSTTFGFVDKSDILGKAEVFSQK